MCLFWIKVSTIPDNNFPLFGNISKIAFTELLIFDHLLWISGMNIFIWNGKKAKNTLKSKARLMCEKINKNERKNKAEIVTETIGEESKEFWEILGLPEDVSRQDVVKV